MEKSHTRVQAVSGLVHKIRQLSDSDIARPHRTSIYCKIYARPHRFRDNRLSKRHI